MTPTATATRPPARPPIDPRIRQRRAAVTRSRGRRRLVWLLAAMALVTLCALAWYGLHTSAFSAKVVTVRGAVHTPPAQVVTAAGLADHPPLIGIDTAAAAAGVERLPWVARATVARSWPDGVVVTVTERAPVAEITRGRGSALVDASGRVLADLPAAQQGLLSISVPGRVPAPGGTVDPADRAGVAAVAGLPPAFRGQVTGVVVLTGGTVHLTLTSPVTVDLGSSGALAQKYEAVAAVLAGASLHPGDVIDVTVPGSPVVTGP